MHRDEFLPLDPRKMWLTHALTRLWGEVEPDADIMGIALGVRTSEGLIVHYTLTPGQPEVQRNIIPPEALALGNAFRDASIDITPDPVVPE